MRDLCLHLNCSSLQLLQQLLYFLQFFAHLQKHCTCCTTWKNATLSINANNLRQYGSTRLQFTQSSTTCTIPPKPWLQILMHKSILKGMDSAAIFTQSSMSCICIVCLYLYLYCNCNEQCAPRSPFHDCANQTVHQHFLPHCGIDSWWLTSISFFPDFSLTGDSYLYTIKHFLNRGLYFNVQEAST